MSDGQVIAMILVAGLLRLCAGVSFGFRPFDDTYITFRYAINLAAGQGFVYNINEPVLGTTAPLWALVLAAMRLAGIPIESGALIFSLAADVTTAVLLWSLLARMEYSGSVAVGSAIVFLSMFDYFSLARSGMETSCFVLLAVATLHEINANRFTCAGLLCGLSCLARPEGLVLVIVLVIGTWWRRHRATCRDVVRGVALLLLSIGSWTAFTLWTFGSVVPQSIVAKARMSYGVSRLARLSWLNIWWFFVKGQPGHDLFASTWLQLTGIFSLLGVVAVAVIVRDVVVRRDGRSRDRALLLLVFPLAYVGGLATAHAFLFWPWYYGPIYPFAVTLAVIGVSCVVRRWRDPLVAVACVVLIVGQVAAAWLVKVPGDRTFWVDGYVRAATNIPRDEHVRVAACEIGALGWAIWPSQVIDLAGLVTPQAVGTPVDIIVRSARPEYIVFRTDNVSCGLSHLESAPWLARDYVLDTAIGDPYFAREFRMYKRKLTT